MTRGIGDPAPEPQVSTNEPNEEINQIINDLILGQNKLHDRIIDLERRLDHMSHESDAKGKWWTGK